MAHSPSHPETPIAGKGKPVAPNASPNYLTQEQKKAAQAEKAAHQAAAAKS